MKCMINNMSMKTVLYLTLVIFLFGCSKEDSLTQKLEYENFYAIEDDPSDPVKHRVYEIYKKYNVPVYFNDTIKKSFVKEDVNGNPVYRYETLDLAWSFSSYSQLKYRYKYLEEPEEQSKALDIIENYLNLVNKALYPYNFFVVKSLQTEDSKNSIVDIGEGAYQIYFRTLLMTADWKNDETVRDLPEEMMREMVKNKISNYETLLTQFYSVSKSEWYDRPYEELDPDYFEYLVLPNDFDYIYEEYGRVPALSFFGAQCFDDGWSMVSYFDTPEGLENFRACVREKIGAWGFVSNGWANVYTPNDKENDLTGYISEMLKWSPEEFKEKWGGSPLVMQKYNILYEIIVNELGVEL